MAKLFGYVAMTGSGHKNEKCGDRKGDGKAIAEGDVVERVLGRRSNSWSSLSVKLIRGRWEVYMTGSS